MHSTASKRSRAAGWNSVSAGAGPRTSMPAAIRSPIAGAISSISSLPSAPLSPACGLSAATASRGADMPNSLVRLAAVISPASTMRSRDSARMASFSGRCTVTGTTRKPGQASIMIVRAPASSARHSVWPGWRKPASSKIDFWIRLVMTAPVSGPDVDIGRFAQIAQIFAGLAVELLGQDALRHHLAVGQGLSPRRAALADHHDRQPVLELDRLRRLADREVADDALDARRQIGELQRPEVGRALGLDFGRDARDVVAALDRLDGLLGERLLRVDLRCRGRPRDLEQQALQRDLRVRRVRCVGGAALAQQQNVIAVDGANRL